MVPALGTFGTVPTYWCCWLEVFCEVFAPREIRQDKRLHHLHPGALRVCLQLVSSQLWVREVGVGKRNPAWALLYLFSLREAAPALATSGIMDNVHYFKIKSMEPCS